MTDQEHTPEQQRYSDDRLSLAQEIAETLRSRGHWAPSDAGPDLITAVGVAMQGIRNPAGVRELVEAAWGVIENPDMKAMMRLSEALTALDAEESSDG